MSYSFSKLTAIGTLAFKTLGKKALENIVEKGENAVYSIFSFFHNVPLPDNKFYYYSHI